MSAGGSPAVFGQLLRELRCCVLLSAIAFLPACQEIGTAPPTVDEWKEVVGAAAIADLDQPLPVLTPIVGPRARLVTWKRSSAPITVGSARFAWPVWATVDGELRAFCHRFVNDTHPDSTALRRRIEHLLGMRDGDGDGRVIVEFSLDSREVFRPCPDPAIDTVSCPVSFDPKGLDALLDRDPIAARLLLRQLLLSYVGPKGYPFTRRGYTYDWDVAAAPAHHVGLSEYVTSPNSSVEIISVTPSLDQYCSAR